MGDVIRVIRVVNIETKYDKNGDAYFVEHPTIQRASTEPLQNLEIDYDANENRRLVVR